MDRLPEIFMLAAGALAQTRFLLEGLEVNPKKIRENLDITKALIMSEAVMMGWARCSAVTRRTILSMTSAATW